MTCPGCRRSSVVRSVDSALLCLGGVMLGLVVGVALLLGCFGELRVMIGRWFMALIDRK